MKQQLAKQWKEMQTFRPYVQHLTNFVTVNDCANITLAAGGSPIMTINPDDSEQMIALCHVLVINIGSIHEEHLQSMLRAGKEANRLQIPVVLDPVGVGATLYRQKCIETLLDNIQFAIIRGNRSEIATLTGMNSGRGVDADPNAPFDATKAEQLAKSLNCVISASGPIDFVTDGMKSVEIANGHPLLADVTGTGCMTASITGCCVGAGLPALDAAVLALVAIGIAGEEAARAIQHERHLGTFRQRFFDGISAMNEQMIEKKAKVTYA